MEGYMEQTRLPLARGRLRTTEETEGLRSRSTQTGRDSQYFTVSLATVMASPSIQTSFREPTAGYMAPLAAAGQTPIGPCLPSIRTGQDSRCFTLSPAAVMAAFRMVGSFS